VSDHAHPLTNASPLRDGAALAFALLFPLLMAWVYFVAVPAAAQQGNPILVAAYGAGKLIQFLFPALYVGLFARSCLRPGRPTTRGLGLGVAFAVLVAVAMFVLYFVLLRASPLLADTPGQIDDKLRAFGRDTPAGFVQLALFLCIGHSLFEEYYWRWFVFGWLKRYLPLGGAIALSAVGFTLHHVVVLGVFFPGRFWTLALPLSLCVGAGGAFWAWLYHRSGSLAATWISHALVDAAIMAVGYVMLRPYWV
jgi:membrane protease YdiL (CAAX protease family)